MLKILELGDPEKSGPVSPKCLIKDVEAKGTWACGCGAGIVPPGFKDRKGRNSQWK